MFPFVPAGSVLSLRLQGERPIGLGDIVCYPGRGGELVAHRVIAIEAGARGTWLTIRGDAVEEQERIELGAVGWLVERVEHRWLRYDTASLAGRTLARVAVRRGGIHRFVTLAAHAARRLLRRAHVDA